MRLLYCIINEFNIYSQQIDLECDIKKLFSIIVYKNLFPEDFSNLQINKGILYAALNNTEENIFYCGFLNGISLEHMTQSDIAFPLCLR